MVAPGDTYDVVVVKKEHKLGLTIRRAQLDGGTVLVVSGVAPEGPASSVGVVAGSLLMEVNGQQVTVEGDDPFSVLGVDRAADAPAIRKAWREKVLLLHPDKGGDAPGWHRVSAAYAILRDDAKRGSEARHRVGSVARWDLAVRLGAANG